MDDQIIYKDQRHIVIYRKGVYFKLDVYKTDSDGKEVQLSIPELYALLQQVIYLADGTYYLFAIYLMFLFYHMIIFIVIIYYHYILYLSHKT